MMTLSGAADPGHVSDGLRVETIRAEAREDAVAMIFLVRNTGEQLSGVELAYCDIGEIEAGLPVTLNPGDTMMLQVRLLPTQEVPDMFTVMFDFGDGSIAPVLVFPE